MMNQIDKMKDISAQEFAAFGIQGIAYVRPVVVNDIHAYAIHAADGTQIAVMTNREVAIATVRQHDLEPLSVH